MVTGLAQHSDVACRKHCAFNFPAVVKSLGAPKFAVHLLDSLTALSTDNAVDVRQLIAAGFHELASLLGTQRTVAHLKQITISLLGDSAIAVCGALVSNLGVLLSQFKSSEDNEVQQVCGLITQ